eukprot:CAMPEP_0119421386 /NCGR_PEP_ID=MMETSP1335-20130426/25798_1 /TAXON_ID=259385 /ORGANISM="Chrysoculter rhomboideus, Strain RCC1486" /LENGTH=71 /DNA_ID=CAMNT_0007446793 /DNA_START=222 /DNA_END=437 /DNA_ORIENTATION=+
MNAASGGSTSSTFTLTKTGCRERFDSRAAMPHASPSSPDCIRSRDVGRVSKRVCIANASESMRPASSPTHA